MERSCILWESGALYFWIEQLCLEGVGVVWVDEEGTLEPDAFSSIACQRFWMVKPSSVEGKLILYRNDITLGVFEVIVIDSDTLAPEAKEEDFDALLKLRRLF